VTDHHVQSGVLEDLTEAVNYRHWLAGLAAPYLGDNPIEVGSGIGDYADVWLHTVPRITVTETHEDRLKLLHERFVDDTRVDVRRLTLPADETGEHSAAVALNVLEHIRDHVGAIRSVTGMLRPGGRVVLIVPAFEFAMSKFDRTIGHERRYTRASAGEVLTAAGLEIEELRYLNPLGLMSWFVVCRLLGSYPRNGVMLRTYDRAVVPLARGLERRWRPPFGQSVFAVGRKSGF
jgi:SAM-dependent methyltransferase